MFNWLALTILSVYVFSIPVKSNDRCLSLMDAVKYLNNEVPLNKHLLAYYPFDENTRDLSGNNRHGASVGGALVYSDVVKSNAAKFHGVKKVVIDMLKDFTTYQGIINNGYYKTGS